MTPATELSFSSPQVGKREDGIQCINNEKDVASMCYIFHFNGFYTFRIALFL